MTPRSLAIGLTAFALIGALAGCNAAAPGSSAGATSSPGAASPAGSAAPTASTAATATESALPSFALPSFQLPSGAKELEALLPAQMCGGTSIKFSMSGAQFAATADKEFTKTLSDLGKSPSDVSFAAAAAPTGNCSAGIFRIQGVDQARLQEVFLAASQQEGSTFTQASVSGKNVYVITTSDSETQYVYFNGDAVLFAQAKTQADAASILADLP
jgi:hypothetical protein